MYPYYQQWYDWSRQSTVYPYDPAFYQAAYQNQGNVNGWYNNGYNQNAYVPQNPFPYSYGYTGYTENGNPETSSFQAGALPKGVMNYFQNEDGQLDFDKMMSTTGQVVKTVQQVSPIVKGIGTFVKGFK